jgi:two-component system cell cycle sensor histidine kinase/response regulator CckA
MAKDLRVLHVEDSETDAALIVRLLEKAGYQVQVERVEDAPVMRAALGRQAWDVVIADYRLPRFDAPAALRTLREAGLDIPFIVVSGTIGEDLAVAMMKAGAHDYLMKNNLARLAPAVEREIREAASRRERKQAEQDLRDSEERLSLAIQATQLGTFDITPRNGKVVLSEFLKRQFGLPPDAVASYETFLRALHPDDRERTRNNLEAVMRPGSDGWYSGEFRAIGIGDEVERRITAWGRVFFDDRGLAARFVGITLDVSEPRRLEEEFRQAQKLESVGRLAGGVAHDFNNILTVIIGYAQMILGDMPLLHPLRGPIDEIYKAADRAAELTRQLLAFSRHHVSETKIINLNDLLSDLKKMLGRLIGEDIQLTLSLCKEAVLLRADPGRLEQVIMNLAVNARDAMPGGGKLNIATSPFVVDVRFARIHPSLPSGPYVMLSVNDSGVGMSADLQSHIFEPFFTTKEKGKGTGLGLSTVYGIVTQCGGAIWVNSEPGKGSTFTMLFPAVAGETPSVRSESAEPIPSGKETILVAEDDSMVRKFIAGTLVRYGYLVLESSNGRAALELAGRHPGPIHLLVTDAIMPEMGGGELSEHFRSVRPGVPVLCMSGYSDRDLPQVEVPGGYIQKPFTPAALLTRVRELLDQVSEHRREVTN